MKQSVTNLSYGSGKAKQMLNSFLDKPFSQENAIEKAVKGGKLDSFLDKPFSQENAIEKAVKGGKLDTTHLILKDVMVNGKMAKRWVNPATGQEHAKHGSKIAFMHKGEKKTGIVGSVMATGEYAIKGTDGKSYAKHHHQFDSPHAPKSTESKEEVETKTESKKDKSETVDHGHPDIKPKNISAEELDELDEEAESGDINQKFKDYAKFVRMVAKGDSRSGIAYGTGGVGKTFTLESTLEKTVNPKTGEKFVVFDDEKHTPGSDEYDYVTITGKATTSGIIAAMYEHNGKMLVFDDCDTALTQPDTIMMFKGALDSKKGAGKISSLSARPLKTSTGDSIPATFKFDGRVFFISNLKGDKIDQAIKSRSLRVDLTMTVEQTIERIKSIAEDKQGRLTNIKLYRVDDTPLKYDHEDMKAAIELLEKYKNKTSDLNVRTLSNIVRMIHDGKEEGEEENEWKSAAKSFLLSKGVDDDLNKTNKNKLNKAFETIQNQDLQKAFEDLLSVDTNVKKKV